MSEVEASHSEARPDGTVACRLCPHRCEVAAGARGICAVRENLGGVLYTGNYQEVTELDAQAVERVPLYHFKPGSRFLVVGSYGHSFPPELAAWRPEPEGDSRWATAGEIVDIALEKGVAGLAYAGGEPFMWLESWLEIARRARAERLLNVAVTNGFALPAAIDEVAPLLDAANLLFMGPPETYKRRAQAEIEPVLECARRLRAAGSHLEVAYTVLGHDNDGAAAVDRAAADIEALGTSAAGGPPVHVTSPPHFETAAPVKSVQAVATRLAVRLPHVYLSDVYGRSTGDTVCRACKAPLVRRAGARVEVVGLAPDGKCAACGADNGFRI